MAEAPTDAAGLRAEIAQSLFLSLCPYAHRESLDALWADWNCGGYSRSAEAMADRLLAGPLAALQARATALEEALREAETCMMIVPPRSDMAAYLRTLEVVRSVLNPPEAP